MDASMYRQVVEIVERRTVEDNQGFQNEEYASIFKFRAYVNNLSGKEYWEAKKQNSEMTVKIYTYYCSFFTTIDTKNYFIKFNNEIYDIQIIDNIQYKNKEIQIKAIKRK